MKKKFPCEKPLACLILCSVKYWPFLKKCNLAIKLEITCLINRAEEMALSDRKISIYSALHNLNATNVPECILNLKVICFYL